MSDQHSHDPLNPFEDETNFSLGKWGKEFLQHYWPIMFFATLFVLMCAFPMILGDGGIKLAIPGLLLLGVFGLAITLTFLAPILLAPYLLLLAIIVFVAYPERSYNASPTAFLGVMIFYLVIMGSVFFLTKVREGQKASADKPYTPQVTATDAGNAVATVAAPTGPEPKKEKGPKPVAFDKAVAAKGVTIIFGSESGNAEGLAEVAKSGLASDGHAVQILDAAAVDYRHLKAFANLLIITSTWGEGDPPSNAIELVGDMKNTANPHDVSGIQFSVCGLGDTNYELFCQCGKDFDSYLEKSGGKRLAARVDCNVDYDGPFQEWLSSVRGALKGGLNTVPEYEEPVAASVNEGEGGTMGEPTAEPITA